MERGGPEAGGGRRLTRRGLKNAAVPEILEWMGRQKVEKGVTRKEMLATCIWQKSLAGEVPMIRLLVEYLSGKPASRPAGPQAQQLELFKADELGIASRDLPRDEER